MKAKRILVTGGAGFVGNHLIDELLRQEYQVDVFDCAPLEKARSLEQAKTNSRFSYFQGDIRDKAALAKAFHAETSMVFHLASIVGVNKYMEDPLGLIDITIGGTRAVAELAMERKAKMVFTSTSEVFGKNPNIPWTEESDRVLGPTSVDRWSYSTSKATCEHILHALHRHKGLDMTIVRYFNAYGPRQSPIFVVSQSVKRALKGEAPYLYDGGEQTRCFTYIEDAVRGTIMAGMDPKANGESFNIGNDKEITMKEAVELVLRFSGSSLKPSPIDTGVKYGKVYEDIPRRVPSNEKARSVLGWRIQVPHEEGIRRTVEWAKANPWWLET